MTMSFDSYLRVYRDLHGRRISPSDARRLMGPDDGRVLCEVCEAKLVPRRETNMALVGGPRGFILSVCRDCKEALESEVKRRQLIRLPSVDREVLFIGALAVAGALCFVVAVLL